MSFNENTLIQAALAGDRDAVRTLTHRLSPVLYARVRRFLTRGAQTRLGADDVDDLVQSIWEVLLRDGGRQLLAYDTARGASLEGFVGMVAERELSNRRRDAVRLKRGGGQSHDGDDTLATVATPNPDPESLSLARSLDGALVQHLNRVLGAKGRQVLRLLFQDDRSPQEVAAAMCVNLQVVYNWQHHIRVSARAFLAA